MKAKLTRREDAYMLLDSDNYIIASNNEKEREGRKLSTKNCQTIERGYDLDELAWNQLGNGLAPPVGGYESFIRGFQKALEILGDRKFTDKELIEAIADSWSFSGGITEYVKSLQKTEWEVEVLDERDSEGRLILKRV